MTEYFRRTQVVDAMQNVSYPQALANQVVEWFNSNAAYTLKTASYDPSDGTITIRNEDGNWREVGIDWWIIIRQDNEVEIFADDLFRSTFVEPDASLSIEKTSDGVIVEWLRKNREATIAAIVHEMNHVGQITHGHASDEDVAEGVLDLLTRRAQLDFVDIGNAPDAPADAAFALDVAIGDDQAATWPGSRVLAWLLTVEFRMPDDLQERYRLVTSTDIVHSRTLGLARIANLMLEGSGEIR